MSCPCVQPAKSSCLWGRNLCFVGMQPLFVFLHGSVHPSASAASDSPPWQQPCEMGKYTGYLMGRRGTQALGDQMTWFVPESPEELRPHHGHPVMDLSSSHTPLEWMGRVCVRTPLAERFKEVSGVELISPCVAATLLPSACQGNNWSILKWKHSWLILPTQHLLVSSSWLLPTYDLISVATFEWVCGRDICVAGDPWDPCLGELQGVQWGHPGCPCLAHGVALLHRCAASAKPAACPAGNLNFCSSRLCCNQDLWPGTWVVWLTYTDKCQG